MTVVVTGSSGHLGEAVMRTLFAAGRTARGVDIKASEFTTHTGSITDREFMRGVLGGAEGVIHAAALHKPHVVTHSHQQFVDVNISGTLSLLEVCAELGVRSFVYTSTTSVFGNALLPGSAAPAAWIDEDVTPIPKNIYGATKLGAEHLCEMFANRGRLAVVVLRTSRFFPEDDDSQESRSLFSRDNLQTNELLYRRADIDDVVAAHLLALDKAPSIGFDRFVISAPTPIERSDLSALRANAVDVVLRRFPEAEGLYAARNWSLPSDIDRVYSSRRAVERLGWRPEWDFPAALKRLQVGDDLRSALAKEVGEKGYHARKFEDGPYPVENTGRALNS